MAVNLLNLVQGQLSGDVVARIASMIGESPGATESAVASAVPAMLATLAQKATTTQGASELVSLIQRTGVADSSLASLPNLIAGGSTPDVAGMGGQLLDSLFGSRLAAVAEWIARNAGISVPSATSLLRMIAPVILGLVAKQAGTNGGLNVGALTSLLGGQTSFLKGAVPAGLAGALGIGSLGEAVGSAARAIDPTPTVRAGGSNLWKWVIPALAVVVAIAGVRTCRSTAPEVATTAPGAASGTGVRSIYGIDLGALRERMLPGGTAIKVPERGVESQLIVFIDSNQPIDANRWFTLDRVEFEAGSATLRPSSQEQVGTVVAILKAYPAVALKVGGYTDSSGDDAANMKLSQDRADNTRTAIVAAGVAAERLEAEGYGEQFPVASNDTEEGRQRNRRVDVRVTKK